jgi:hypothetical protein
LLEKLERRCRHSMRSRSQALVNFSQCSHGPKVAQASQEAD